MPEGDTLWRTAAALRERLSGKTLTTIETASFRRLESHEVNSVESHGKHLFISFDSGLALHSHLGMHGSWYVHRPNESLRRPEREITSRLIFDEWVAVVFAAPVVKIVAGDNRVQHLGPDILADSLDKDAIADRALSNGYRAVGEVLLDQRVCAGIGNIYKCESLWVLRINPWLAVEDVGQDQLARYTALLDN